MDALKQGQTEPSKSGVRKITPVQQPALPSPRPGLSGAFPSQPMIVNGQLSASSLLSSGNTQNVAVPGAPSMLAQQYQQGNNSSRPKY